MSYLNFLYLFFLAFQFSGKPMPADTPKQPVIEAAVIREALPSKEEDAELIPWIFERRLTWEDFLSEPKRNSDAVASTSTTLGLAYQVENGQLSYRITCHFSKHKSWGLLRTDYILAHEQGHFDITEIFARKLYKELQEYPFNRKTYRSDVNAIYNRVVKEKEAMQAAYDGESDHSRSRRLQYDWLEKIDTMLEETEPWSVYP
jgi:predicted secreted Zn-dependent protease